MNQTINSSVAGPSDSFVRRLRHTPMRDVLRLRFTGRLDIARLITSSGLPAPLGELVLVAARRSRLWRNERVDIARELIAHFQDGLESGATADDLKRSFGDVRAAARLIGKAKKRQRPLAWRASVRVGQAVAALLLVMLAVYTVAAIQLTLRRPTISHDYLADANRAALATPVAERAWPLYREAILAMRPLPDPATESATPPGEPESVHRRSNWPSIADWLIAHGPALDMIRQAAAKPQLGYVCGFGASPEDLVLWPYMESAPERPGDAQSMFEVLLPQLSELMRVNRVMNWDAQRAAQQGQPEVALANLVALFRMGEQVAQSGFLISQIVGFAIFSRAMDTTGDLLWSHDGLWSNSQLQELAHAMAGYGESRISIRLEDERIGFLDAVQRMYTDDGSGSGRMTSQGMEMLTELRRMHSESGVVEDEILGRWTTLSRPVQSLLSADRRSLLAEHERFMAIVEAQMKPLWQMQELPGQTELRRIAADPIDRIRFAPLLLVGPSLARAHVAAEKTQQRREAMLAAIAMELFRRECGRYPVELQELVPKHMPSVPRDRFTGQPLRYRIYGARRQLYSVGADRDDDGGTSPVPAGAHGEEDYSRWLSPAEVQRRTSASGQAVHVPDGDWILWPTSDT